MAEKMSSARMKAGTCWMEKMMMWAYTSLVWASRARASSAAFSSSAWVRCSAEMLVGRMVQAKSRAGMTAGFSWMDRMNL